ncbi:DUF1294 domain-containing protein [Pseudoxanthomonas gei]|uniref:DUF1294 domain-containing protein n=1 Tax=Pseudoxanthomonas gei TaxID=1383030 RepID=A0ABX0AFY1_9GAMM|nr:DUF1294 domain-containing protein [Pseudoxanthomonas gei]NDK39151.1 DUF1294 domain-containing protein [Pseudoxanthomonas gei]
MHCLGKVQDWNDERGYGFIAPLDPPDHGGRTFFHIRDYQQQGRRPETGELVKYLATRQDDGRWKATRVMRAAQPLRKNTGTVRKPVKPGSPYSTGSDLARATVIAAYAGLLGWAIRQQWLPLEFAFVPVLASIVTFMAYAADKHAAQTGRWRIPEANLHLLELLCGWPGALFSQRVLRHKSRKPGYLVAFRMMVVLNLAATVAWIYWKS